MKISHKAVTGIIFYLTLLISAFPAFAQEKPDVVVMLTGEERKGKVTAINDEEITFVYAGETLEYKIERAKINKIIFASGRTQVITETNTTANTAGKANGTDRKGKLAVLPFKIITNDPTIDKDALGKQVQTDCANTIRDEAPALNVIEPRLVNATLAKNNISVDQLEAMLPNELAVLLGVEQVILGSYTIENTGSRTTGSSVTTYKSKEEDEKKKGTAVSSGSSTTQDTYDSSLSIDIYNDQGTSIYSAKRKPFSAGVDNYHSTIKYLVKRAPFGSKG